MLRYSTFLTVALVSVGARGGLVTVSQNELHGRVNNGGIDPSPLQSDTTLDTSKLVEVSDGASSSSSTFQWNSGADYDVFQYTFDHAREGNYLAYAQTYSYLTFTPDVDTTYTFEGAYSLVGSKQIISYLSLEDTTANNLLFEELDHSYSTPNESFTVGVFGEGDNNSPAAGSTTGTLIAGRAYQFYFTHSIQNYPQLPADTSMADATGYVTLTIGEVPSAVPEPSSLLLLGIGSLGLGAVRRRRTIRAGVG